MKRTYTLLMACLFMVMVLYPLSIQAQSDFKPGFVVLISGDTLSGWVDYRSNMLSTKVCKFKSAEAAAVVSYSPQDVMAYGFPNDRYYASKYVQEDSATVFMEELVRSKINLYTLNGAFYVEKEGLGIEELVHEFREYYSEDGVLHRTRANKHIATLNKYMNDCIPMIEKIERVSLTQSSLIRLIKEYNECSPGAPVVVFKESKPWFAAELGVAVGVSHTSLSFSAKDESYLHLEHSDFGATTYPVGGLLLNLRSPRVSEYTSLQLETHYFKTGFEDQNSYDWFGTLYENEMEISMSAVKLNLAVRHEFNSKTLQPYANAGIALNFFQDREIKHMQYVRRTAESTPEVRNKDDKEFITNRQTGIIAGAGFLYNLRKSKMSAEIRYEYGLDVHNFERVNSLNSSLTSTTGTVSFITGYYF
ncbi:PorT family protein [Pontibacter anaerobius]|uniref:PorT family protein n=1 Tax=Pontibacter anaerobius TaxID=2993940 RepID=A0ABT3RFY2_9BACT|nr:PorT family protein [Pontibacter anaerobius]MCX2740416.1 PorT family protein [Pontibacter anaerobius]